MERWIYYFWCRWTLRHFTYLLCQDNIEKKELCTKISQSKELQTDHSECNQIFEANTTEEIAPEPDVMNVLGAKNLKSCLMESMSKGNAHLYASSFFPQHNIDLSLLNPHDIHFSLLLANFIQRLTKPLQDKFTTLMKHMKSYMLPSSEGKKLYCMRVPVSIS